MPKETSLPTHENTSSSHGIELHDLLLLYLIWFFLAGLTIMTRQMIYEGSPFFTQGIQFLFFIALRMAFVPVAISVLSSRPNFTTERIGMDFQHFWQKVSIGCRISLPVIPLTLLLIHLPLVYKTPMLHPLYASTTPETIAVSLVYSLLLFFMTLIPAFSEELLFRGITFTFLQERLSTTWALILSSLAYGFFYMQFNTYMMVIRILLGFFCTHLFWRSKSLIPSACLQAAFHTAFILYVFGLGWW